MHPRSFSRGEILDHFVTTRLEQAPLELKRWYGESTLRRQLSGALEEEVARLDSRQLAELFAHHCPIPQATVSDYYTRCHHLPGLGLALTGIRFWGLDLNRPFVTVIATEKLPRNQQGLAAAVERLRDEYQVFKPRHIRLLLPTNHDLQPAGHEQFWEKRLLAAPLTELLDRPLPANYERAVLRRSPDTSSYRAYQKTFEELLQGSPQHHEYSRLESEEDLTELAQAGTLFDILVDGTWAGIVAVDEQNEEGLEGYRVVELLLTGEVRGQRLATAVQRRLAEQLWQEHGQHVLFGTIDQRNRPAIRAAQRAGRHDIAGYFWAATRTNMAD